MSLRQLDVLYVQIFSQRECDGKLINSRESATDTVSCHDSYQFKTLQVESLKYAARKQFL